MSNRSKKQLSKLIIERIEGTKIKKERFLFLISLQIILQKKEDEFISNRWPCLSHFIFCRKSANAIITSTASQSNSPTIIAYTAAGPTERASKEAHWMET
jgi:hypothetical protein